MEQLDLLATEAEVWVAGVEEPIDEDSREFSEVESELSLLAAMDDFLEAHLVKGEELLREMVDEYLASH